MAQVVLDRVPRLTDPVWRWMYGVFFLSLAALLGSLYYGAFGDPVANIAMGILFPAGSGLYPCFLCWIARILMYPLVLISGVGIWNRDVGVARYVMPFAVLGMVLEAYHYALQKLPLPTQFECTGLVSCDAIDIQYFGFVTIPFLCLFAFGAIAMCALKFSVAQRAC